jgi:hypothetical protein
MRDEDCFRADADYDADADAEDDVRSRAAAQPPASLRGAPLRHLQPQLSEPRTLEHVPDGVRPFAGPDREREGGEAAAEG